MLNRRATTIVTLILCAGLMAVAATPLSAQQRTDGIEVPVTLVADTGQTVDGTFQLRRFSARGDEVVAVGLLSTQLPWVGAIENEPVRVAVQRVRASCHLFRLVMGPVDVDAADDDEPDIVLPVKFTELRMEVTADEGDRFTRLLLCGIGNMLGDGAAEVNTADLPVSADQLAQLLNRAIRLFR